MALKYYVLDRPNLKYGAGTENKLYYGQICANDKISYQEICENVCVLSTATAGDVACIMDGLMLLMRQHLMRGYIVELGDLGNFRLSAGSHGVKNEKDFEVHMFKKPKILFSPGPLLKELCKNVHYEKAKCTVVHRECSKSHG